MSDRTIHAETAGGVFIVRYDRAGKWYAERGVARTRLTLGQAVDRAVQTGSSVYLGKPGGGMFDRRVAKTMIERALR